jgi:hypothetical protein
MNFYCKIKYTNSRVYYSYCRDENIADQCVSQRSNPEHFNRFGLRSVLTIDVGFLSGWYAGKLFMACGYDAEQ